MLVGILTGGLVYAARARRASAADAPEDLLELAPADSVLIAYIDLAALRNSPLMEQFAAMGQPAHVDKDYADFVSGTGFDYQRDLDRVLITSQSGAPSGDTLIFAEGRFDREKIERYALHSGKQESRNGHSFYEVPLAAPGKSLRFAFLGGNRMALSNSGDLSAAFSPASASALDPGMRDRLSRVSGAPVFAEVKASVYVDGPGGPAGGAPGAGPLGATKGANPLTAPFASLQWISLAARPDGNQVILSLEGECKRPEDAQSVAGALQFLRGILRSTLANPKSLGNMPPESAAAAGKLIDAMSISTEASRVRLLVSLTPDMFHLAPPAQHGQPAQLAPAAN